MCDGKEDCSDGGDEQLCNFICYNMETIAMEVSRVVVAGVVVVVVVQLHLLQHGDHLDGGEWSADQLLF